MMSGQFLERNAFWFSQFNRWQHRKAQVDEDAPILPCVFEIDFALLLTSTNAGSLNRLRIEPKGLKSGNQVIERDIDGTVAGAEVADLNVDGSPELYVYVTSAGSGSYGSLVAYAANKKKSLSEIYLPPLQDDPKASKG